MEGCYVSLMEWLVSSFINRDWLNGWYAVGMIYFIVCVSDAKNDIFLDGWRYVNEWTSKVVWHMCVCL